MKESLLLIWRKFKLTILAVVILVLFFVVLLYIAWVPSSRIVEEGSSLYRVGEDKEYGVVCYKSKNTSGISCVKVK